MIGLSFTVCTKLRPLTGPLADKKFRGPRKKYGNKYQNAYSMFQSVGIHMKYVFLVLLLRLPKYLIL